jgi:hypothetical protein
MLENLQLPHNKRSCRTRSVLQTLNPLDYGILMEALADDAWTSRQLSISLANLGIKISRDSIDRHRTGNCSCDGSE